MDSTEKNYGNPNVVTEITDNDVLFGRGAPTFRHPGNVQFRDLVKVWKAEYNASSQHQQKKKIANHIIDVTTANNGRFLREVKTSAECRSLGIPVGSKAWVRATTSEIDKKVKQALREGYDSKVTSTQSDLNEVKSNESQSSSDSEDKEENLVQSSDPISLDLQAYRIFPQEGEQNFGLQVVPSSRMDRNSSFMEQPLNIMPNNLQNEQLNFSQMMNPLLSNPLLDIMFSSVSSSVNEFQPYNQGIASYNQQIMNSSITNQQILQLQDYQSLQRDRILREIMPEILRQSIGLPIYRSAPYNDIEQTMQQLLILAAQRPDNQLQILLRSGMTNQTQTLTNSLESHVHPNALLSLATAPPIATNEQTLCSGVRISLQNVCSDQMSTSAVSSEKHNSLSELVATKPSHLSSTTRENSIGSDDSTNRLQSNSETRKRKRCSSRSSESSRSDEKDLTFENDSRY